MKDKKTYAIKTMTLRESKFQIVVVPYKHDSNPHIPISVRVYSRSKVHSRGIHHGLYVNAYLEHADMSVQRDQMKCLLEDLKVFVESRNIEYDEKKLIRMITRNTYCVS